ALWRGGRSEASAEPGDWPVVGHDIDLAPGLRMVGVTSVTGFQWTLSARNVASALGNGSTRGELTGARSEPGSQAEERRVTSADSRVPRVRGPAPPYGSRLRQRYVDPATDPRRGSGSP